MHFLVFLFLFGICGGSPAEISLPIVDWLEEFITGPPIPTQTIAVQMHTGLTSDTVIFDFSNLFKAALIAVDLINNNTFPDVLPNTKLILDTKIHFFSPAAGLRATIEFVEQGHSLITGYPLSAVAFQAGIAGAVYDVAMLSPLSSASVFSDKITYPYFSRVSATGADQSQLIKDTILYYHERSTGRGWTDVAVISEIIAVTSDWAERFIEVAEPELDVIVYRQFLTGELADIGFELNQVKLSGARVIVASIFGEWESFIAQADEVGLVGEQFIWITIPSVVSIPFREPSFLSRGVLGVFDSFPPTPEQEIFLEAWQSEDSAKYPTAGPGTSPISLTYRPFDMILTAAKAMTEIDKQGRLDTGERISASEWTDIIRATEFSGVSGPVRFDQVGDRVQPQELLNYIPEEGRWVKIGIWTRENGLEAVQDAVWFSNTTEIPDLDIRESFDYWSCHKKKEGTDETGKHIILRSPGSSDVDFISIDYHCDQFIDCQNLSDESADCGTNYKILFIVFGVITGLLILVSFMLIIFVIVFGLILGYRRLRHASPVFLILILISMIIGYSSVYAWFGKPHPVACGFQPWLLGLAVNSMVVALCVKNFRIWRIFKFPMKKLRISDVELMVLWFVLMIPAVVILIVWTIVATPTAKLEERDGENHFVCATGGFLGDPFGYIFFGVFVGYCALILLMGAVLSVLLRNIPSDFNETKILTISIYNLGFLSAVIIPVFLVVQPFNPFIAWILRTCAILYAFTATMILLFVPMLFGVFILDKGKNVKGFKSNISIPSNQKNSSGAGTNSTNDYSK